jgi:hypothetical protein
VYALYQVAYSRQDLRRMSAANFIVPDCPKESPVSLSRYMRARPLLVQIRRNAHQSTWAISMKR